MTSASMSHALAMVSVACPNLLREKSEVSFFCVTQLLGAAVARTDDPDSRLKLE